MVLYVHGWHNNARPEQGDLYSFRQLMAGLAETNREKQVTGIYVSWDANSDIPLWYYLDFWSKMGAADRIAASGTVTNVVAAIASMVARSSEPGQFIAIGHSFGARILMASTAQNTIAATQRAHPGGANAYYREIEGLAQTTILLNPAFEAAYWTPIQAFNRSEDHFSPDQKPVLLAISTDNDAATGYAFPLAQWVAWKTAPGEVTTLGNYLPFWTHELSLMAGSHCRDAQSTSALTESYDTAEVCLHRAHGFEHNPFMLVHTDGSILTATMGSGVTGFQLGFSAISTNWASSSRPK